MDCHVANAPRNDVGCFACNEESHVTARQDAEAVQACLNKIGRWIASSLTLLAMT